jgi:hypothetical protein
VLVPVGALLLNIALQNLIAFYKAHREANASKPLEEQEPMMDDAFIIELLGSDSQALLDKIAQWNAEHPPTT